MRALLVQAVPAPGDPEANARAAADALEAHPDADLAVFPELFLTGYDLATAQERAIPPGHQALGALRDAAALTGTAVLAGFAERLPGGGVANSVACIDSDGAWAGTYRKTHLFGREREVFQPGGRLLAVELAGLRIGVLVCFDVEFPEPSRALAFEGADVLVTLAANMAPYGPDHDLAARARALDNRLPHVYVNRAGGEGGLEFVGASMAVGADGVPLLKLGGSAEAAVAEIDLDAERNRDVDYLHHLRTDLRVEVLTTTSFQGGTR